MVPSDGYIRWQCRRGMLELDVPLSRFCDKHLASLTNEEIEVFLAMLAEQDPVWLSWILGESTPDDPVWSAFLDRIKSR